MRLSHFILLIVEAAAVCLLTAAAFGQDRAQVPMKFRGAMPAVEVMVNGKGPFLFAIDTGGQGQARADTSLVEALGLKKVGEARASDGSGKNTITIDLMGIDSIRIGGLEFKGIEAASRDYNRAPQLPKIDGILGFGLFEEYLLTLDFANEKVVIEKGSLPAENGKDVIGFDPSSGVPGIEIDVEGRKVKAHLDTGNLAGEFMIPESIVPDLKLKGEPEVVGRARTVTSEIEIKRAQLDGSITFGGITFKDPQITFPALRDANVGSRALKGLVITFDQKNKRMRIVRSVLIDQ